jgi:hypothetical protein
MSVMPEVKQKDESKEQAAHIKTTKAELIAE